MSVFLMFFSPATKDKMESSGVFSVSMNGGSVEVDSEEYDKETHEAQICRLGTAVSHRMALPIASASRRERA